MLIMYKAYKFRLYPNNNQEILINKTFGCVRIIYNYFLGICNENNKCIKYADMCNRCTCSVKNITLKYFDD